MLWLLIIHFLISHQTDIDKIYLNTKDQIPNIPNIEIPKYQLLFNKRKNVGTKHFNGPIAFIEYSNNMNDIHENIDEHNPNKNCKNIVFIW